MLVSMVLLRNQTKRIIRALFLLIAIVFIFSSISQSTFDDWVDWWKECGVYGKREPTLDKTHFGIVHDPSGPTEAACGIPHLEPWSEDVRRHFPDTPAPLTCAPKDAWTTVDNGTLRAHRLRAICRCSFVSFATDFRLSQEEVLCKDGDRLRADFFSIQCSDPASGDSYQNYHASIRPVPIPQPSRSTETPYSVYIFGFDSISRQSMVRFMPKSFKYWTEKMGGIVLESHNVVGDGTTQNLLPMLSGITEEEEPLTRKRCRTTKFVDVYPFIWRKLKEKGYATLFAEDEVDYGAFQYRLTGFKEQPVDHYLRLFHLMLQQDPTWTSHDCIAGKPNHIVHFDYSKSFFTAYPNVPKFAFSMHVLFTHTDPSKLLIMDEDMLSHLKFLDDPSVLRDTFLIFMSDHGFRFGAFRQTFQGKMEERLPWFSIRVPDRFRATRPREFQQLQRNAHLLTTPFDIYETLMDVVEWGRGSDGTTTRGLSLFRPLSPQRTCASAGIESHWCSCLSWTHVSLDSVAIHSVANAVVTKINSATEHKRSLCVPLTLKRIQKAVEASAHEELLRFQKTVDRDGFQPKLGAMMQLERREFQVVVQTSPGDMVYEATATLLPDGSVETALPSISILTKYGDLPFCVKTLDAGLNKWCVCRKSIG